MLHTLKCIKFQITHFENLFTVKTMIKKEWNEVYCLFMLQHLHSKGVCFCLFLRLLLPFCKDGY